MKLLIEYIRVLIALPFIIVAVLLYIVAVVMLLGIDVILGKRVAHHLLG